MTIKELDNIIDLYADTSAALVTNEKELLHLAIHMKAILEAWESKPVFDLMRLNNTLDHAVQPFYKERTQR